MAEQSKNIPGFLLSILNALTDDLNNDSLEYLLSHFGDLGPHRNEIRSVLPEPDMFYAYWIDPDDFKKEELYIKCYFPGGDVKASYELADLLRTSCSANPFVWRFLSISICRFYLQ